MVRNLRIESVRCQCVWVLLPYWQLISNDGDTLIFAFLTKMIASGVKILEWLFSRRETNDSGKEIYACSVVVSNYS